MRRFRQGATRGPGLLRPGAGYGRLCFGAPGPTQEVQPREELVPEMFTGQGHEKSEKSAKSFKNLKNSHGDTIIDLTND